MSQNTEILNHLKLGGSLTAVTAVNKFGCYRLAARINDLRNQGYEINSKTVQKGKVHFSVYSMKYRNESEDWRLEMQLDQG